MKAIALFISVVLCGIFANASNIDQSAYFDGNGDRIRVLDSNPINENAISSAYQITGNTITLEAWVYPMNLPGNSDGYVIACRPYIIKIPWMAYELRIDNFWNGNDDPRFQWVISDGNDPGNWGGTLSPQKPVIGNWTHVAGTYDGSELRLYINGELVNSTPYTSNIGPGETGFYIGGSTYQYFNGLIDDVRLWNVARTQSQIQSSMNEKLIGDETGLAGYWPMDESYSPIEGVNVMADKTTNHNDLQIQFDTKLIPYPQGTQPQLAITKFNYSNELGIVGERFASGLIYNGWPKPVINLISGPSGLILQDDSLIWTPDESQTLNHQVELNAYNSVNRQTNVDHN